MAKDTTKKILQTKLAISERSFRTGEDSRLDILKAVQVINDTFKTAAERRAPAGEKVVECRSYRSEGDIVGLHLVAYIPDDSVGIVPHNAEDLSLLAPPKDSDFLDGELMALIAEEAIIFCRLGLFESALNSYIQHLGPQAKLDKEDASFLFKNRTDVDKLRLIEEAGVASIRFDGVANAAAVSHGKVDDFIGNVWSEIKALAYADASPERDIENLKVEVFLKFDKRSGTQIDQEEIQEVAEHIADADDGFVIKTLDNRTIRPTDVLLNKTISVQRYGKSVAFNDIFAEMLEYYQELTAPGDE